MKFAGLIAVIISTSAVGVSMYRGSEERLLVCRELILLCDGLRRDFLYKSTPLSILLFEIIDDMQLNHLGFIKMENVIGDQSITSPLGRAADRELTAFFSSLGTSDTTTQLDLVESLRLYLCETEEELKINHTKNSRLYLSFGVFSGVLIALIFV